MAQAIPKSEWLDAEDNASREAYFDFLVECWLWQHPFSLHASVADDLPGAALSATSHHALLDFGWYQEPRSTASH